MLNSLYRPLYPTFAGPFAEPGSRPLQPDFRLPECYTVDNIHHVREKMPSFSDETLFWIFYTQPRDIIQEFAAQQLYVSYSHSSKTPLLTRRQERNATGGFTPISRCGLRKT